MFFGEKLKELRLKDPSMSLRDLSIAMDMMPSVLSKIEHGYMEPPQDPQWLYKLVDVLGLEARSSEEMQLFSFWTDPFVMQEMPEFCPAVVCTEDGNPLSKEKMIEFVEWMNDRAKEHNKKAREYNGKQ